MNDKVRIKIWEADAYLEDAQARLGPDDESSATVAINHGTNAIIMALDALGLNAGFDPPKRHDLAEVSLRTMMLKGKLAESASAWRDLLIQMSAQRTRLQYRGTLASRADARRFVRDAVGFVAFARGQVQL